MSRTPSPGLEGRAVEATVPTRAMLIVLVVGASLAFSMAFACATPFAALAAVAVLRMKRRDALIAVILAWVVNQADGFLFMHYPRTWDSFGWGIAIGAAAVTATVAASAVSRLAAIPRFSAHFWASCGAFVAAFCVYESVLLAATLVLPSSAAAFAPAVIGRLVTVNAFAFVLLVVLIALLNVIGSSLPPFGRVQRGFPRVPSKPATTD